MATPNSPRLPDDVVVRRVRNAYEQVAEQLREAIVVGALAPGQRLPTEETLAGDFGVSRATVREGLRLLAAQNLVRTAKGNGGGSYINIPTIAGVSELVTSNLGLMSASADISLDDFLEARELIEVPATRLAAERLTPEQLKDLAATVPDEPLKLSVEDQFVCNRNFHSQLMQASGNPLLTIAAQPIFLILQTHLQRSRLSKGAHQAINDEHREIVRALENRDPAAAENAMRRHLQSLRSGYERTWHRPH
jgi:DNA-binding FadR family transcriptional regulator